MKLADIVFEKSGFYATFPKHNLRPENSHLLIFFFMFTLAAYYHVDLNSSLDWQIILKGENGLKVHLSNCV